MRSLRPAQPWLSLAAHSSPSLRYLTTSPPRAAFRTWPLPLLPRCVITRCRAGCTPPWQARAAYATHALLLLRFRPAAAAEPAGSVGARLAGAW